MIKKLKLSRLVLDYNLYPREHLDPYHINKMVEVLKVGKSMPPIIVDKTTFKVVDGFHRVEAYRRLYGDDYQIESNVKEYDGEAEMFKDAIQFNASHGRSLSRMDEAYCLAKAKTFKLEQAVVASLLNITVEKAEELIATRLATSQDRDIVLKGSTAWMAGRRLTEAQTNYNRKAGGLDQTFYINQVIAMIESDSVNWNNEKISNGLKRLCELLETVLKVKV